MFDLNKLGDMAKLANEAKKLQDEQGKVQRDQTEILKKISNQLDTVIGILKAPK